MRPRFLSPLALAVRRAAVAVVFRIPRHPGRQAQWVSNKRSRSRSFTSRRIAQLRSRAPADPLARVASRAVHYLFQTAQNSPSSAPLHLWLNGGPGCSSLEGAFAEMGALLVDEQNPSTLVVNPSSWNNISHSLYLEAPACVGYSYADDISGCSHDDSTQAQDNYQALLQFFTLFPEYATNDFFITGESYAGIYVPTLAKAVYLGNKAGGTPQINLKGIMVGNGCLGSAVGVCAFDSRNEINTNAPFFAGHGLIAPTTYSSVLKDCTDPDNPSDACNADISLAHQQVGNVNVYDIYADCIRGPGEGVRRDAVTGRLVHARAPVPVPAVGGPIACIDETIAVYIGSPAVAAALHVIPTLHWAVCGSNSSFSYSRTEQDERVDVYPVLVEQAKINVLVFNGEADACVPWVDNECVSSCPARLALIRNLTPLPLLPHLDAGGGRAR